jgi:hypothetical protein
VALAYAGLDCGECIAPRRRLAKEEVKEMHSILDALSGEIRL